MTSCWLIAAVTVICGAVWVETWRTCYDRAGPLTCSALLDAGLCALCPQLSHLACGSTCGFCPLVGTGGGESARMIPGTRSRPPRWRSIDRLPANVSYDYFARHYKSRGVPVIIEGWLYHEAPSMIKWNLALLKETCDHRPIALAQRRAHLLRELKRMLGEGLAQNALNLYMSRTFNTTVRRILFLEHPRSLRPHGRDIPA